MNDTTTTPIDFDTLVGKFIKLRDKIKEIEDRQSDELKPYKEMREKLEAKLLEHLETVGADKVGTAHGTVSKSIKHSASIADMNAFWNWCVTQGTFDLIDKKANVTAVRDHIAEHGEPPPGVNFNSMQKVSVLRARTKPE